LVAGFGGLRDDEGVLALDPQLPDGLTRLRFRLRWKGFRVKVDITHDEVVYALRDGPHGHLAIKHAGQDVELDTDAPAVVRLNKRVAQLPAPPQPVGRAPLRRRA
jgi:trehalose/maltose hydrolase-like predicted phosphorylase